MTLPELRAAAECHKCMENNRQVGSNVFEYKSKNITYLHIDPIEKNYQNLLYAVVLRAIHDYIECVCKIHNSHMKGFPINVSIYSTVDELNEYFRNDCPMLRGETILKRLRALIESCGYDEEMCKSALRHGDINKFGLAYDDFYF